MKILATSDWHLTDKKSVAVSDDSWYEKQFAALQWMNSLCEDKNIDVILLAGDIFDKAKQSNRLVRDTITALNRFTTPIYSISGNHDQPAHNYKALKESSYGVLCAAGVIEDKGDTVFNIGSHSSCLVLPYPFGHSTPADTALSDISIVLVHRYIDPTGQFPGGSPCLSCQEIKEWFPGTLIIAGDNHTPFTWSDEKSSTTIINPGSLFRYRANQIDHRPLVYIVEPRSISAHEFFYTITPEYVPEEYLYTLDRSHLEKKEEKEKRGIVFIESLGNIFECDLSFSDNLSKLMRGGEVSVKVRSKVNSALGDK